ncbi:MAG: DUF305 domain-containing protein [Synechococcaceae cyanobacterium SM2_3_2]|nr:DUF305 domain-containing protein [Synechococcaceae cyanobacterium SM2_3_2]
MSPISFVSQPALGLSCSAVIASTNSPSPELIADSSTQQILSLGSADDEFDLRFLDAIILHHQSTISTAAIVLEKSNRSEVRAIAETMIDQCQQDLEQLQMWRQDWYPSAPIRPQVWDPATASTISLDPGAEGVLIAALPLSGEGEMFNIRVVNRLIPHHESALVLAREALTYSQRPEVQAFAETLISTQQADIQQWEDCLEVW